MFNNQLISSIKDSPLQGSIKNENKSRLLSIMKILTDIVKGN